jgi:C-terminal processing protease CtpA/Prc
MDRGWSFVTTVTAAQTYFEEGTSVGFGIGFLERAPDKLLVTQVYPGSAAASAGLARGDEILRIGETPETLAPVAPLVAADLANHTSTVGAMFGPATVGETRAIELAPAAGGAAVVRSLTKGSFSLDPVPAVDEAQRWRIVPRDGKILGYVALRTFVATADARLEEAFAAFKAAGVTDVVVDLRYNGGGLVSTGELLANLLGGDLAGSTMVSVTNSSLRSAYDEQTIFAPPASAVTATRIAFITTGASASASELVPNVLEPHKPGAIAFVGAKTYGKPVGQRGFRLRNCEPVVYLVSFKLENAQGDGEYFGGLPDAGFSGPLCAAEDDLLHPLGDPAEASTSAALAWLETGACPAPPAAKLGPSGALEATIPDAYPEAPEPTLAQRHVRGLF